jgi:hypothetical protein
MTKTCATCKHSHIEHMSISCTHFSSFHMSIARNVFWPDFSKSKERTVEFDIFSCNHEDRFYDDPVSGEKVGKSNFCVDLRKSDSEFCGLSGEKWEKRL